MMSTDAGDREREALRRFTETLTSDFDLRRIFPAAIAELSSVLDFDGAALLVHDEPRGCLRLFSTSIPIPDRVEISLRDRGTISTRAVTAGEILRVEDTAAAEFAYDRRLNQLGFRSHVAYPLLRDGRVVGTLNLASRRVSGFGDLPLATLAVAGTTLAIALDHALLFERMRSSEQRYASLIEGAREFIYQLDPEGRIVFANDGGSRLLGRGVDDMQGRMWSELIHPGDARPNLLAPLLTGEVEEVVIEVKLLGAAGNPVATSHRIHSLRDAESVLIGLQGVARDLGREREADRAVRLHHELVEALDDYVFMADTSGRILAINRKAREALGWDLAEVKGMTIWDLHPPEDKAKLERERWRIVETGASTFEVRLLARSGHTIPTRGRVTYSPESGTFQGVYRDTTEEQLMQERMLQVERLRALGEMASGVAHTFNNLLAVIGTTVAVTRRLTREEPVLEQLKSIEQVVFDGGAAVRRIQDFTRKRPADLQHDVDLAEVLREAARVAGHRARSHKGPAIEIVATIETLPLLRGSESELKDAVLNLLFNAIDAMPDGGRIDVRGQQRGERVVVEVSDTGRGMSPEVQSRVFTPFFSTKGERGSGLGLSIALNVVAQHGGTIEVDSRPGAGTTMRVLLPVPGKDAPQTALAARVLLVIAEPLLRMQLHRAIAGRGHQAESAATAAEARVALARSMFEVVFVDRELDGTPGLEIADRARAGGARVVLLTGWGDEVSEAVVNAHKLDALLRKPFPTDAVLNLIHALAESGTRRPG